MANVIYSIAGDTVDPVFFPVVPDSFMKRETMAAKSDRRSQQAGDWHEIADQPILAPNDRWSF